MGMKGKNHLRGLEETVPEELRSWGTTCFHRQAGNKASGRVLRNTLTPVEGEDQPGVNAVLASPNKSRTPDPKGLKYFQETHCFLEHSSRRPAGYTTSSSQKDKIQCQAPSQRSPRYVMRQENRTRNVENKHLEPIQC